MQPKSSQFSQIPSDLVVKSQIADIIGIILQLIRHQNGIHRACRNRKSRGAVLSTSEVQWATTKFDGVWLGSCTYVHLYLSVTHERQCCLSPIEAYPTPEEQSC